VMIRYYL